MLGADDNVLVQERLVKINHDVPTDFPPEVLEEAQALPAAPGRDDMEGRIDLRHLEFVTIDGAKARDFDDAVYVEEQGTGYRLWVAIADAHAARGPFQRAVQPEPARAPAGHGGGNLLLRRR